LNALRVAQRVNYMDVIYNLLASGAYLPEIASYLGNCSCVALLTCIRVGIAMTGVSA
jgi:hypothetical protein